MFSLLYYFYAYCLISYSLYFLYLLTVADRVWLFIAKEPWSYVWLDNVLDLVQLGLVPAERTHVKLAIGPIG